jgi:hypothetical protein
MAARQTTLSLSPRGEKRLKKRVLPSNGHVEGRKNDLIHFRTLPSFGQLPRADL